MSVMLLYPLHTRPPSYLSSLTPLVFSFSFSRSYSFYRSLFRYHAAVYFSHTNVHTEPSDFQIASDIARSKYRSKAIIIRRRIFASSDSPLTRRKSGFLRVSLTISHTLGAEHLGDPSIQIRASHQAGAGKFQVFIIYMWLETMLCALGEIIARRPQFDFSPNGLPLVNVLGQSKSSVRSSMPSSTMRRSPSTIEIYEWQLFWLMNNLYSLSATKLNLI